MIVLFRHAHTDGILGYYSLATLPQHDQLVALDETLYRVSSLIHLPGNPTLDAIATLEKAPGPTVRLTHPRTNDAGAPAPPRE